MTIVFFDFDGTITKKDSLLDFTRYAVGNVKFIIGLIKLSPALISRLLKIKSNDVTKEIFLRLYFKGWNAQDFQTKADEYSLYGIKKIVKKRSIERIKWHLSQGHKVVVVSASLESWLRNWCAENGLELIATRIEIKENYITGKLASKNCYGQEKVNRIKKVYDLNDYHEIYAYGDSDGDKELLLLAGKPFYRSFGEE